MKEFYFAQKAFIVRGQSFLGIQKSMDDPNQPGKWEVPGGRMEFGEDVDEHLKREVLEEVGMQITPGLPFYVWQWRIQRPGPGNETRDMQIVAVARICETEAQDFDTSAQQSDDFLGQAKWIAFEDIQAYDWIPNMLPVLTAFQAQLVRNS